MSLLLLFSELLLNIHASIHATNSRKGWKSEHQCQKWTAATKYHNMANKASWESERTRETKNTDQVQCTALYQRPYSFMPFGVNLVRGTSFLSCILKFVNNANVSRCKFASPSSHRSRYIFGQNSEMKTNRKRIQNSCAYFKVLCIFRLSFAFEHVFHSESKFRHEFWQIVDVRFAHSYKITKVATSNLLHHLSWFAIPYYAV